MYKTVTKRQINSHYQNVMLEWPNAPDDDVFRVPPTYYLYALFIK